MPRPPDSTSRTISALFLPLPSVTRWTSATLRSATLSPAALPFASGMMKARNQQQGTQSQRHISHAVGANCNRSTPAITQRSSGARDPALPRNKKASRQTTSKLLHRCTRPLPRPAQRRHNDGDTPSDLSNGIDDALPCVRTAEQRVSFGHLRRVSLMKVAWSALLPGSSSDPNPPLTRGGRPLNEMNPRIVRQVTRMAKPTDIDFA